ncbi:MAG: multicopper oxidase family protein [Gammaproteobacteria bacterium]|nr:multicopper oxidase family protein [Gammaproteobacteria bacterium]
MQRRQFLQCAGFAAVNGVFPTFSQAAENAQTKFLLTPKAGKAKIVGPSLPATDIWGFDGQVPGSLIRTTLGESLDIRVHNALDVPTAVHWHGVRLPNSMDGVAGLTQAAIEPGDTFRYEFKAPDAGTYWYHSHVNAYEQVGRGLYGPLIIDEPEPPLVDRDLIWMIDDWRLLEDASISDDFGAGHDLSHAGRIGNVPTVNGRFRDVVRVRTGERIRLRLINASNARNFALSFGDLQPTVIAVDGQAVKPMTAKDPIVVGAAGRVDLILDMTGDPGSTQQVMDGFYRDSFLLTKFVYLDEPLRDSALDTSIALPAPQLPEPDLLNAHNQTVTIAGGAMGGLQRAKLDGEWMSLREIAQQGYIWSINDVVGNKLEMQPLIDAKKGESIRLTIENKTRFPHPMHLHGHHMKLLSIDHSPLKEPRWVDSPLVMPNQVVELAFVADNPGRWLFHCHALEHHAAGLGTLVQVS